MKRSINYSSYFTLLICITTFWIACSSQEHPSSKDSIQITLEPNHLNNQHLTNQHLNFCETLYDTTLQTCLDRYKEENTCLDKADLVIEECLQDPSDSSEDECDHDQEEDHNQEEDENVSNSPNLPLLHVIVTPLVLRGARCVVGTLGSRWALVGPYH